MLCDNACRARSSPIVSPQCYDNPAVCRVTITYNEVENDVLDLCDDCATAIRRDARRHGYYVKVGG